MDYFDFHTFWNGLNRDERAAFAATAGVSPGYIGSHLRYARRQPGLRTISRLHQACTEQGAVVTIEQLIRFFSR